MVKAPESDGNLDDILGKLPWLALMLGIAFLVSAGIAFSIYPTQQAISWIGVIAAITSTIFGAGLFIGYMALVHIQRRRDEVRWEVPETHLSWYTQDDQPYGIEFAVFNRGLRATMLDKAEIVDENGKELPCDLSLEFPTAELPATSAHRSSLFAELAVQPGERRFFMATFRERGVLVQDYVRNRSAHLRVHPVMGKPTLTAIPRRVLGDVKEEPVQRGPS